jgi:hypothetical protein
MNIVIKEIYSEEDCETGYLVTIDGKEFGDYLPSAQCYGGVGFTMEQVLLDLLKINNTVEVL